MIVSSSVEVITKSKAIAYLEYNEGNRPIRRWQVEYLAGEMARERFSPTATIAFAQNGKVRRLVNGQHTLGAIVSCDIPQALPVVEHNVSGPNEMSRLFAHYDIGLKRTFSDAVSYYGVVDKLATTPTNVNKLSASLRIIASSYKRSHKASAREGVSNEDVIDWVYNWHGSWRRYLEIISPCEGWVRNRLTSRAIAAVALMTVRYSESEATLFWRQVAKDDGLGRGDPRHALHKKLLEISTLRTMTGVGYGSPLLGTMVQSGLAAWSWNKYVRGKDVINLKAPQAFRVGDIYILNTPFKKPDVDPILLLTS